jgi:ABC-type polysaccharide/polyol phosphate export permease
VIHWANPFTPAIVAFRAPLYDGTFPPTAEFAYLAVAAVLALALGAAVFNAVDDRIASEA